MYTPVLLIIFNRFDTTKQVIAKLREAAVPKLYVYCDGPRKTKVGEAEQLKEVQEKVVKAIDWPCELVCNFREENEGPRLAIGHAVSWFFETEEQGIILEHDCVPHISFFNFCETLLKHYEHDERVMHISGDNFQFGRWRGDGSYYFSKITHIWGWATWKRAWKFYDADLKNFNEFENQNLLKRIFNHQRTINYWQHILSETYQNKIQTWDYQWSYAVWLQNGLAILPNVNLVSNIGFDENALNTVNPKHILSNIATSEMSEIKHPSFFVPDADADNWSMDKVFNPSYLQYFVGKFFGFARFNKGEKLDI